MLRRPGGLLSIVLLVCALAGTIFIVWLEPCRALSLTFGGCVAVFAVCGSSAEYGYMLLGLATIFAVLAALILMILGSAGYPYDD